MRTRSAIGSLATAGDANDVYLDSSLMLLSRVSVNGQLIRHSRVTTVNASACGWPARPPAGRSIGSSSIEIAL